MLAVAKPQSPTFADRVPQSSAGLACQPWGSSWLAEQGAVQRSYLETVVRKLGELEPVFEVKQYGALSYDRSRYPLLAVLSKDWQPERPCALVTAGVHGEASTVEAALSFLRTGQDFVGRLNLVVVPCVSPWGYETMNRWNPNDVDPNHAFKPRGMAEEARKLGDFLASLGVQSWACHVDLHESLGLPAPKPQGPPGGLRIATDVERFERRWLAALLEKDAAAEDVALHASAELGLCLNLTDAPLVAATELSPGCTLGSLDEQVASQVRVVAAGLRFALAAESR